MDNNLQQKNQTNPLPHKNPQQQLKINNPPPSKRETNKKIPTKNK